MKKRQSKNRVTSREVIAKATSYHIHVKTGDVAGAGTDANVYLIIYGAKGDTGQLMLRQSASFKNKFERGKTDVFKIRATDIGQIKRIKVGHDGTSLNDGWFLDMVKILVPSRGEQYVFACHRWLAKDEADGLLKVEMDASYKEDMEKTIPYEVTLWTGNKSGAGTDANVFLQIYGTEGKTESYNLRNKTDNFEKGMCDKFKIEAADVGRIQKVRIGHGGTGTFSGWYMDKMLIQRKPRKGTKKKRRRSISSARDRDRDRRSPLMSRMGDFSDSDDSDISSVSQSRRRRTKSPKLPKKNLKTVEEESDEYDGTETEDYWFLVDRWFARSEDDKQIVRELIPTDEKGRPIKGGLEEVNYTVRVFTGDEFGAGTDANVFINLYGDVGDTGERQLKDSSTNTNKFERKQEDVFIVKAIELGKLGKLEIRHDNAGGGAAWFLDRVEVDDPKNKKKYFFPCQRWLSTNADDGQISRELVPVDASLKSKMSRQDSKAIRNEIALETKDDNFYKRVLTRSQTRFVEDLNPTSILDLFLEREFLPYNQVRDIGELPSTSKQTRQILNEVTYKGFKGYSIFKKLLKKAKQGNLANYLYRQEANLEKEMMTEKKNEDKGKQVQSQNLNAAPTKANTGN
ncbi:lipoxygenase homology domain-containing protein 1-like [Ruditapes philippinarum]|uniref:lipoxygenase homology domain-containing protein 1-like n=1 Tax=Ruditapes philippinarum TaxID=129788 RepID=UPI00295BA3B4|nr:lipoxygenase homology domain-containing protein 1-like [Ruditapes philippinarum]